jgi:cytochrome c6
MLHKLGPCKTTLLLTLAVIFALVLAACGTNQPEPTAMPILPTPEVPEQPVATWTAPPPTPAEELPTITPTPEEIEIPETGEELVQAGDEIYMDYCAACHQEQGEGFPGIYPPLAGSGFVTAQDPDQLVSVIITGRAGMPSFHPMLNASEIAAVVTFIRGAWGNSADPVSPSEVVTISQGTGLDPLELNGDDDDDDDDDDED